MKTVFTGDNTNKCEIPLNNPKDSKTRRFCLYIQPLKTPDQERLRNIQKNSS